MKEMQRKIGSILNDEKGTIPKVKAKPKGTLPTEDDLIKEKEQNAKKSFTGLVSKGVAGAREKVGQGSLRTLAVNDWMKNLDKQVLYMEKTDQVLIERMKEAEREK